MRFTFLAALGGAAIGGIIAALVTGDAWAFVVALVAGIVVYVVVGAALDVAMDELWARRPLSWRRHLAGRHPSGSAHPSLEPPERIAYLGALVLAVAAFATALLYVFIGPWLAVVAVVLLVAVVVFAVLAMLSGG